MTTKSDDKSLYLGLKLLGGFYRNMHMRDPGLNGSKDLALDWLLSDLMLEFVEFSEAERKNILLGSSSSAPRYTKYSPPIIVHGQRTKRPKKYYFPKYLARSFSCKYLRRRMACEFDFKGNNDADIEYYIRQALHQTSGNNKTDVTCSSKRRGEKIECKMYGQLADVNPYRLKQALYGT